MRKARKKRPNGTLRAEYDFSGGVRGKHAARYARGTNVVVLDADVARLFPDSTAVNRALRAIARVAPRRRARLQK
ncbi:MAG: hypothetical protein ACHQ1G_10030 [Planctomycetota bacterium]